MSKKILAAEINYGNAPYPVRELLLERRDAVVQFVNRSRYPFEDVFILNTPNQYVVYGIGGSMDPLLNFFLQDSRLFSHVHFYKETQATINHFFAIASGLYTPVKGDHEITAHVKHSWKAARRGGTLGLVFDNMILHALRVGRRVRVESGIDMYGVSVVDSGIDVVYKEFSKVHQRAFVIFGSGKLAETAAQFLFSEGIQKVSIVCHDSGSARALAARYRYKFLDIAGAVDAVAGADVVVATPSSGFVFPVGAWLQTMPKLGRKVFLDLTLPESFADLRKIPTLKVYNVDELKKFQANPLEFFGGVQGAWGIVKEEGAAFYDYFNQLQFAPVLTSCWRKLSPHASAMPARREENTNIHVAAPPVDVSQERRKLEIVRSLAASDDRMVNGKLGKIGGDLHLDLDKLVREHLN